MATPGVALSSQHDTLGDFWSVATMATMATPADQPLKKIFWLAVGCLSSPPTPLFHFFSSFNLGVAMVAIVAVKIPRTSAVFPPGAELPSVAGTATPAGCPAHTPRLHALVRVSRGARVLEHRMRRPVLSLCPSHARPARVRSQVCSTSRLEGRLLPLVVYETTARTALQVW